MESIIERDTKGSYRKQNPEYAKLRYQLKKAKENKDGKAIKSLSKKLNSISASDMMDSNFRRIKYVRYADDFLIGVSAPKLYAIELKLEITNFLKDTLYLRLSDEKTKITNVKNNKAQFLGFQISKPNSYLSIRMNTKQMINKLHENGMCDEDGYP